MQKTVIIVPCYNEALRLNSEVYLRFLVENSGIDLCFVNDGSTDNTSDVLLEMKHENPDQIHIITIGSNAGKANAVRTGMLQMNSKGTYNVLGFLDADLSTPLEEIRGLQNVLTENDKVNIVFGSRIKRLGANISRNIKRHYLGRVFATCVSNILDLPVYDSQCGAKLFKKEVISNLFETPFITSWLFDVEILARLRIHFKKEEVLMLIKEVPLSNWRDVGGSNLKIKHMLGVPFQLIQIFKIYKKQFKK